MASALAELGHEVTLYSQLDDIASEGDHSDLVAAHYGVSPGFLVAPLSGNGTSLFYRLSGLGAVGREIFGHCDLVIGRHAKACVLTALAGIPTVFETHKPLAWFPWLDRSMLRLALRRGAFNAMVTISKPLQEVLLRETRWPESRFLVVHDGARTMDGVVPMQFGHGDRLQVGYVGHLYRGRGIDVIIELARRVPGADFRVIGGNQEDIDYWLGHGAELENLFFTGHVSPSEAASMRLGCDILLAPYQSGAGLADGRSTTQWMSPLKVFEYMASAKPMIVSDFPVLHEILRPELNCLMVAADSVEAWEVALDRLMGDGKLRKTLGDRALQDFEAHYTWRQRAEKIVDFAFAEN